MQQESSKRQKRDLEVASPELNEQVHFEFTVAEKSVGFHVSRNPYVIRGLADDWGCRVWTPEELARRAGDQSIRSFVSNSGSFHLDGTWHPRTILTCAASGETTINELFFGRKTEGGQSPGVDQEASRSDDEQWPSEYALDEHWLDSPGHPLAGDVPLRGAADASSSAQAMLSQSSASNSFNGFGAYVNSQLFLSRGRTSTQLHRDPFDNCYVVAAGTRRWTICHPDNTPWLVRTTKCGDGSRGECGSAGDGGSSESGRGDDGLNIMDDDARAGIGEDAVSAAFQPISSSKRDAASRDASRHDLCAAHVDGSDGVSGVHDISFDEWSGGGSMGKIDPQLSERRRVRFLEVELRAGDALFLPARWWHMVEAVAPWSTAVNWYFEPLAWRPPSESTPQGGKVSGASNGAEPEGE
jgi:hypothetical protein